MRVSSLATLLYVSLAGCATTSEPVAPGDIADPYEGFNRNVFAFNEAVDKAALEPVAKAYRYGTPGFFRAGVRNFLSNLNAPVVFVNDVLQGEGERAGDTLARFSVNSTIGIAGLFDVAGAAGLERHSEDFGQTLAVWGVDSGPFVVLPIIGPSTPRDAVGTGVDRLFDPLTWTRLHDPEDNFNFQVGRGVLGAVSARESLIETFDTLRQQTEPYVAYRRAYAALREGAIRNGREDPNAYENLPDFDDSLFDDFEDEGFE